MHTYIPLQHARVTRVVDWYQVKHRTVLSAAFLAYTTRGFRPTSWLVNAAPNKSCQLSVSGWNSICLHLVQDQAPGCIEKITRSFSRLHYKGILANILVGQRCAQQELSSFCEWVKSDLPALGDIAPTRAHHL